MNRRLLRPLLITLTLAVAAAVLTAQVVIWSLS